MKNKHEELPVIEVKFPTLQPHERLALYVNGHLIGYSVDAAIVLCENRFQANIELIELSPAVDKMPFAIKAGKEKT